MKPFWLIVPVITLLLIRCEKEHRAVTNELTDGFCIEINDDQIINHYDIEYYDFSTHIVYLKSAYTFLTEPLEGISFRVYADFEKIYDGGTLPMYSCAMISGPTINFFYPEFVISIGNNVIPDSTGALPPDPREDERIRKALLKYNQFHAGLKCNIDTIIPSQTGMTLRISIVNDDSFNYYILSPDIMGIALFHYYTNGLYIADDINHLYYHHHIESVEPDEWNSYHQEWFYLIQSKEKKTFTLNYIQFDDIPPGQYKAYFRFPGLSNQIQNKEDLTLENGKFWLGAIDVRKLVFVE